MERWRKIEESGGSFEEIFSSFSDCVLAFPDSSVLGSLLTVDKVRRGEMGASKGLPREFDPFEVGKIITGLEERGVSIPNNFNLSGERTLSPLPPRIWNSNSPI